MPNYMYRHRKVWFLNGDLVGVEADVKAQGMVALKNWTQDRIMFMSTRDFKRLRKQAYTYKDLSELINYSVPTLKKLIVQKAIPGPIGRFPGGKIVVGGPAYFSEEQVYLIRDILAGRSRGMPRKDGIVMNHILPSESELTARLYKTELVYVQKADGTFVPTFPETV